MRELYQQEGRHVPDPVRNLNWWYSNPAQPSLDEVCKEINGWALQDVRDPAGAVMLRAGQQLARFLDARADGSTLSGNWLYIGTYTDAGNLTQRRSQSDPSGLGAIRTGPSAGRRTGASSTTAARPMPRDVRGIRRASASPGTASAGPATRPTTPVDSAPDAGLGAFIMLPEGVARLFVPGQFVDGPWSEHYEPAESPVANPLHPEQSSNPAVRAFTTEFDVLGKPDEFPIVCTTYRLTEHFHYWTKNNPYNVQLQPEFFVEIPEELAREKGIANGDVVRVTSARGSIEGRAMVTRRIKPMQVAGRTVYQIGFPIHWGFLGRGQQRGSLANLVTPTIVDPNSFAPEYKGFLVKLEKV